MTTYVPFQPHDSTGNHRFQPGFMGDPSLKRNLIVWQAPHLGNNRYIEMYVNPQSISFSNKKTITQKRTKGGFLIQYWGEELEVLNISGETGDGGIEAIYPLIDVYRSEQLAFEALVSSASSNNPNLFKQRQPLAPLAMLTVMWYMGEGRRGYFTDFQYDESVSKNGSISYRIGFVVLEQIGRRKNFMPWHRKPWSTTDNPVVSSNGRLVVTGGYAGEATKRVGPLNSPAGRIDYIPTTKKDANGFQQTTFKEQWVDNKLLDPKWMKEEDDDGSLNRVLKARAAETDDPANQKAALDMATKLVEQYTKIQNSTSTSANSPAKETPVNAQAQDKGAAAAIERKEVVATPVVDPDSPLIVPDRIAPSNGSSSSNGTTSVAPPAPPTPKPAETSPTQKVIEKEKVVEKERAIEQQQKAPPPIELPPPPPPPPAPAGQDRPYKGFDEGFAAEDSSGARYQNAKTAAILAG